MVSPPFPSEQEIKHIESCLRDAATHLAPEATFQAVVGADVARQLLGIAETYNADLIVMGTHGRGGVKRLVLGSVADYVVRHASCPVVTVRRPTA
jgi:nucleotide-binding universal stress UspA family protein